ncbi:MAG TPA: hypothetical protein P5150_07320 [Candidatus Ratteibacteria bacterium]|nr:hypothetical protein [Candidatus Ratteibacteria bacterium]
MGRREDDEEDQKKNGRQIIYLRLPAELKSEIFQKAEREDMVATDLMRGILQTFMNYWDDLEKKEKTEIGFYRVVKEIGGGKHK